MPKLCDLAGDFEPLHTGLLLAAGEEVLGAANRARPSMFAIFLDHGSGRSVDVSFRGQRRGSVGIHILKACGVAFEMHKAAQFL